MREKRGIRTEEKIEALLRIYTQENGMDEDEEEKQCSTAGIIKMVPESTVTRSTIYEDFKLKRLT